ncbi:UMP kinase [Candidatus Uhrbacteria bacterium]|nr:UMP kinase [Candidatus Uhrbacteria bacterium]MBT7717265.1 UMP kinase [Candidatus Uhrbacteria bacterium]
MPEIKLQKNKPIIMSVGGSLIVPGGGPDTEFLKKLKRFVDTQVRNGQKILIVTGGGRTARNYIEAARGVKKSIEAEDLDWLGIHATRLNGHLLRTIFREVAHPVVIKDPTRLPKRWKGSVLIGAGWKPGWSTDYVACRMAKRLGVENVINASDIDYVYTEDPRKNPKAKPLNELSWVEYRKMVGDDWHPGKSAPFDPVASRLCQRNKMNVAIVNGRDLSNIGKLISGTQFKGTILL